MIDATYGREGTSSLALISTSNVAAYARSALDRGRMIEIEGAQSINVHLPGLVLSVHSFDTKMTCALRHNFLQVPTSAVTKPMPELTVVILHGKIPGCPPVARWAPGEPYMPHHVAQVLDAAGLQGSYFHDLDHWHLHDLDNGFAVQLFHEPGGYPPWETGAPLRPFLHWHYARHSQRLAHCGTLGIDGKGILLAGAGGSGKSGTVVAGLLNDLQSVGDDYILLDAADGITARPLYAVLKQDPAGFERLGLPDYLPTSGALNWQGKHQFLIQDVAPNAVPAALQITALLVPRVTGDAQTRIAPLPRAEAMMALAASSTYQMPGERESGFRFFSRVARQLPCFRLELGRDPAEIAGRIGDFINRTSS